MLASQGLAVQLLDADVEEPDCHLFLRPETERSETVHVLIPVVDESRCTGCGVCAGVCAFHALAVVGSSVLVFPEICHSCGACVRFCPEQALREEPRPTGIVAFAGATPRGRPVFQLVTGTLAVGEAKAVPVTKAVVAAADGGADVVLVDSPPGTSCPVIAATQGADLVVLVTEPTPFGLHDLELAVEMVRAVGLSSVVVVNRSGVGHDGVRQYCATEGLEIVMELPDDRRIAEAYARGQLMIDAVPGQEQRLAAAWERIAAAAQRQEVRV
jgi:MinD superfamily P-loop ATPase